MTSSKLARPVNQLIEVYLQERKGRLQDPLRSQNPRQWSALNEQLLISTPPWLEPRAAAAVVARTHAPSYVVTLDPVWMKGQFVDPGSQAIPYDLFMKMDDIGGAWKLIIFDLTDVVEVPPVEEVVKRYQQGSVQAVVWLG